MPYQINPNAVIEIQLVGRLHGQTTRNVFHHYLPGGGAPIADGAAAALDAAEFYRDTHWAQLRLSLSNQFSLQYITAQWIKPNRYRQVVLAPPVSPGDKGADAAESSPSGCAAVISFYSELAGKRYRGRKYFAGVPNGSIVQSILESGVLDSFQTLGNNLLQSIATGANLLPPTLAKTDTPPPAAQVILQAVARDTVRYQRRREVGVGE